MLTLWFLFEVKINVFLLIIFYIIVRQHDKCLQISTNKFQKPLRKFMNQLLWFIGGWCWWSVVVDLEIILCSVLFEVSYNLLNKLNVLLRTFCNDKHVADIRQLTKCVIFYVAHYRIHFPYLKTRWLILPVLVLVNMKSVTFSNVHKAVSN